MTEQGNADVCTRDPKEMEGKKVPNLRDRLKDSHYRGKLLHTICISLAFLALGLGVGQTGPTFLDLQIITGTDLEQASAFFTAGSIGYLTGSVIAGAIYNKVNKSLLLFMGAFGLSISSVITPYCEIYGLMIFIRFLGAVFSGSIDTSGNSEHMRIWGSDGQVLMQLLHFAFALGGVISPLYTEPFLAKRGNKTDKEYEDGRNSSNFSYEAIGNFTNTSDIPSTTAPLERETMVQYAFLITGIFAFIMSLPFIVLFVKDQINKDQKKSKPEEEGVQRKLPLSMYLFILAILCSFYAVYCCVEDTFASFLMTFLVREYDHVSKSEGAFITAAYWASFAVSRFLMIFISKLLSSVQLLALCCTLMLVAFISFIISAIYGSVLALSIFAVLAGLGMSAVFPAGFSWTESELIKVTGRVSTCILVSASLGTMVNPLILAYLMDEFSNMWFCYLLVGQTIFMVCIFVFLLCFNRCYVNKRYGPVKVPGTDISFDVEPEETHVPLRTGTSEVCENGERI